MKILAEQHSKLILLEANGDGFRKNNKSTWDDDYQNINSGAGANAFWSNYFQEEWGPNAKKIQDLGEAFVQQLMELGFSESTNPFLTFLKNHFLAGEQLPLTANSYAAINNAVSQGFIPDESLTATTKVPQDYITNLLLLPTLYAQAPKLIVNYFELAKSFQAHMKEGVPLVNTMKDKGVAIHNLFYALFTNTLTWPPSEDSGVIATLRGMNGFQPNSSLRNLTQIKGLLEKTTGVQLNSKVEATDARVTDLVKGLDATNLLQLATYLIFKVATTASDLDALTKYFNTILKEKSIAEVAFNKVTISASKATWVDRIATCLKMDITTSNIKEPVLQTIAQIYCNLKATAV